MCTLANATVLSLEIWRAAAPCANGLSTRSTCGPLAIVPRVFWIRALIAGSVTSSAANTTWLVSVDSVLKLSVRGFSAVVDSVPGRENESVYPEPTLALSPPRTSRATTQTARTTNLRRKHQRARALIASKRYRDRAPHRGEMLGRPRRAPRLPVRSPRTGERYLIAS